MCKQAGFTLNKFPAMRAPPLSALSDGVSVQADLVAWALTPRGSRAPASSMRTRTGGLYHACRCS